MRAALLCVAFAAIAAACATADDLRREGRKTEVKSSRAPIDAAQCVIDNADKGTFWRGYTASQRQLDQGRYEVVVYVPSLGVTQAVIAIAPAPGGSLITVHSPNAVDGDGRPVGLDLADGC